MKIRLLSYSVPTEEFLAKGLENVQDLIAYCARVSNPGNQLNTETSEKLIKYPINFALVSEFAWPAGLITLAQ